MLRCHDRFRGPRFSERARTAADSETDPVRKAELERISRICARVPAYPAESFNEALQSVWFTYIGILQEDYDRCCSLGRMDQYLYPYYTSDIEKGLLTAEGAQDLLDCLWLKLAARNFINGGAYTRLIAGFPVQQQIPVGGVTKDGKDAANELTLQCLQATMNTRLNPAEPFGPASTKILRRSLLHKAAELARMGLGHPSFFNDDVIVPGLIDEGVKLEDAREYTPHRMRGGSGLRQRQGVP